MLSPKTFARLSVLLLTGLLAAGLAWAQTPKALTEAKIIKLIELNVDDVVIGSMLQKDGVAFKADDAVIDRFRKAGASETVLTAVRKAAGPRILGSPAKAITYQDVLELVQIGVPEEQVLKRLKASPTLFTLDESQVKELKKAGASETVLAVMQGKRVVADKTSEITDFAIILDCSASMGEKTKEGPTKMAVAKRVVIDLIQKIPDGLNLSFIIYGHDKRLTCQAVRVVRPMSPLTAEAKSELARVIDRLQPEGSTPIAMALKVAGAELARNHSPGGLVLISDGKETCNGNPAAEAARLARDLKLSFGVNVIGFDVEDDERAALEEIARGGKGKYYDADSATEFREVIQTFRKKLEVAMVVPPPRARSRVVEPKPELELEAEGPISDPTIQALVEQLKDGDQNVRRQAAKTLRELDAKEAAPALARRIADERADLFSSSQPDKDAAVDALTALGPERLTPALRVAIKSKNPRVQNWAARVLGVQKMDPLIVASLSEALNSENAGLRLEAAQSLGKLDATEAAPALSQRIADERADLFSSSQPDKDAAVDALKTIAPEMVTPALVKAMKAKSARVKAWATARLTVERKK
jgi:Mg-chelatase subunit ChlD